MTATANTATAAAAALSSSSAMMQRNAAQAAFRRAGGVRACSTSSGVIVGNNPQRTSSVRSRPENMCSASVVSAASSSLSARPSSVRSMASVTSICGTSDIVRSYSSTSARCFADAAAAAASLPLRHSRRTLPALCPSSLLSSSTTSLLSADPSSLFSYDRNDANRSLTKAQEYDIGLEKSEEARQKVEWIMRGWSAQVDGTLASSIAAAAANDTGSDIGSMEKIAAEGKEVITNLASLLERIEQEGDMYVRLRARVKAQQLGAASDANESSEGDDVDEDDEPDEEAVSTEEGRNQTQAWQIRQLVRLYGAPPGPSIAMYDTLLDTIACHLHNSGSDGMSTEEARELLQLAQSTLDRALHRHGQDGGPNANNIYSMPTIVTYNSILRICASIPYDPSDTSVPSQQLRDQALDVAFQTYDGLWRHPTLERNSRSYVYIFYVLGKFIPPSPSRGNMAVGLWHSATQDDAVLSSEIVMAYCFANTHGGSNGKVHDGLVQEMLAKGKMKGHKNGQKGGGFPQIWWKNRAQRRFVLEGMEDRAGAAY